MKACTIIGGVDGVGKSSFLGILKECGDELGAVMDLDKNIAEYSVDAVLKRVHMYIYNGISFALETSMTGDDLVDIAREVGEKGYRTFLYYVGLGSAAESISRIANRVKRGGHDIPTTDVERRFAGRWEAVAKILPYCDEAEFYDNDNGFVLVAEYRNGELRTVGSLVPGWLKELRAYLDSGEN